MSSVCCTAMRVPLAGLVLAAVLSHAPPARASEANGPLTGTVFLAQSPERRVDYVAGLSDQLVQLHQAQLVDGFQWFERCARDTGAEVLAGSLAAFIEAKPGRAQEPVARNFIWAAAKLCTAP